MPDPGALPPGAVPGAAPSAPTPDLMGLITTLLAGAGFKNVSKGITDLASSGVNAKALMGDPTMKMFMAGAGIRDTANSMDLINPMMKAMFPPPPPPGPDPQEMSAAMQMLSSNLGPGLQGIRPPMGPSAMGINPPLTPTGPMPPSTGGANGY